MKIGILSKRKEMFAGDLSHYLQSKGHIVKIYTLSNLNINEELLNNDLFILKSKQLFFLYAGYFIESNNLPIYPNPEMAYKNKNRIEAFFLIKQADLLSPNIYLGMKEVLNQNLPYNLESFIQKPIMSSGSKRIKIINHPDDIEAEEDEVVYLERFIKGTHYLAYFIRDDILVYEKEPLANEHAPVKEIEITKALQEIILKWKNTHGILFGHLDLVKENNTNKIYIVDTGCFPEFSHWKCNTDAVKSIGDLILNQHLIRNEKI